MAAVLLGVDDPHTLLALVKPAGGPASEKIEALASEKSLADCDHSRAVCKAAARN
jgi:hypothetical protein